MVGSCELGGWSVPFVIVAFGVAVTVLFGDLELSIQGLFLLSLVGG